MVKTPVHYLAQPIVINPSGELCYYVQSTGKYVAIDSIQERSNGLYFAGEAKEPFTLKQATATLCCMAATILLKEHFEHYFREKDA